MAKSYAAPGGVTARNINGNGSDDPQCQNYKKGAAPAPKLATGSVKRSK